MDLSVVKLENNLFIKTEIYIKPEPIDNSNEFLTEKFAFTDDGRRHDIKNEILEPNIKSENIHIKEEIVCDSFDVDDQPRDFKNIFVQPSSGNFCIEKKEEFFEIAEEKLHETEEYGEPSRQNKYDKKLLFLCDVCGKEFDRKSHLIRHFRIHSGEKPYKCHNCEKSFSVKSHLSTHILIHTGDKPYKCDLCHKTFKQRSNLVSHKLTHSVDKPFACNQCDQRFKLKRSLTLHKRIHSEEKPYKCDVCNKTFKDNSNLKVHRRVHTGERPFSCDICNMSFTFQTGVKQHKLKHHTN